MPKSKHRKEHAAKKTQRRRELELKRHQMEGFAKKVSELLKQEGEEKRKQEANEMLFQTWNAREKNILPSQEIFPDNSNII